MSLTYDYIPSKPIKKKDALVGGSNASNHLLLQLRTSILKAKKIDIIVSFLMESGVTLLLEGLEEALNKGVNVRVLTGNYLGITQPSALYLIKQELDDRVDLRLYTGESTSFHPKAYIFHGEFESEIYIGSSNLSKSALTSGIEWNYRFTSQEDNESFQFFCNEFNNLFDNHSIILDDEELRKYSQNWRQPAGIFLRNETLGFSEKETAENDYKVSRIFRPRGVQIEALYALEKSRKEGADRGLIHAATGIGKTYLAAFDSLKYERVLFVAHREEILKQAANSFANVRGSENYGFFTSEIKDIDKNLIFASVASLGKDKYLNEKFFSRDYFNYIIIDEFHHAVSDSYRRIIDYFEPEYLLGLTATPDRMDGADVYELCDYIVPYEISLKDAINKGVLTPFNYYGIYDETVDYSKIRIINGKYDLEELEEKILIRERYDLIYKHYMKYRSRACLGFCSSIRHAEKMAQEFSARGIKSVAVHSGSPSKYTSLRDQAIKDLASGRIKVIFSVDIFNEGLDIPFLDMVMFLRPTESPVVFLQQLGRGLRKYKNKERLVALDFIGNYKKASHSLFLLSGESYNRTKVIAQTLADYDFPENCNVDFDFKLIDLFKELARGRLKISSLIEEEYLRIKEILNKSPSRMELFHEMEKEIYDLCMKNPKESPFKNYLAFKNKMKDLDENEEALYNSVAGDFINMLETTQMQKSYKIPILEAFYNNGDMKMDINQDDVYKSMKKFYNRGLNGQDLMEHETSKNYKNWRQEDYIRKAKEMPINFLKRSSNEFFQTKEGYLLSLTDSLKQYVNDKEFVKHVGDAIAYRTIDYYRRRYKGSLMI